MTFGELTKKNKSEVRSNSNLTLYFKEAYKEIFGSYPSCSGCSINNEFTKLVKEIKSRKLTDQEINLNIEIMEVNNEKTFIFSPKFNDTMLFYDDKNGIRRRKFSHKATDEFVIEYLTIGTPEQIEERKKNFKQLPLSLREEVVLKPKKSKTEVTEK